MSRWVSVVALLLCVLTQASAATIKAELDRNPIRLGETLNLVFSADETPDDDPDFTPLQSDFEILSQGQSSQMSIANGRLSRSIRWELVLSPKRAGQLSIPPIAFGKDRSTAVTVTVDDAAPATGGDSALFLEVEASPKNPYVQAQVIYVQRFYYRVRFANADLSEPTAPDALIQRLGDGQRFMTERGGQRYEVFERKYSIAPQKSGKLRIEPSTLTAQVADAGRSRFFRSTPTRTVRIASDAVELDVRPVPAAFAGKHWLPAEALDLQETWTPDGLSVKAGDPITRTVTLKARGTTLGLLPELGLSLPAADDIKLYPDQPVMNEEKQDGGIASSRQEKIALIPGRAGRFTLPALEIPWWNTQTDRMEIARLPERVVSVAGAAASPAAPGPAATARPVPEPAAGPQTDSPVTVPGGSRLWFWLALAFGIGWAATGLAWWWSRRPRHQSVGAMPTVPESSRRQALADLRKACKSRKPRAAHAALLVWGKCRWPDAPPVTVAELAQRAGGALREQVERLERALYGRDAGGWEGSPLLAAVEQIERVETVERSAGSVSLAPLYRIGG